MEVNKKILAISPDRAAGIDKITACLLRLAAPAVAPSIAKLINLSFCTGAFTIVLFQCYLSCQKSLSAICTIRYTLFSAIIT